VDFAYKVEIKVDREMLANQTTRDTQPDCAAEMCGSQINPFADL